MGFGPVRQELHVYCDASEVSIGFLIYMRSFNVKGDVHVAFVTASSKLTPKAATTIPRLELCATLEATRCVSYLLVELRRKPDDTFYYTDSKIVLG